MRQERACQAFSKEKRRERSNVIKLRVSADQGVHEKCTPFSFEKFYSNHIDNHIKMWGPIIHLRMNNRTLVYRYAFFGGTYEQI